MVRNYVRKTDRGKWDEESMVLALQSVMNGELTERKAAAAFCVPKTTLHLRISRVKQGKEVNIILPLGPIRTVFTTEEERELVKYIQIMECRLFGLDTHDLRSLAYQLAVKNNKVHTFSQFNEKAGRGWLTGFLNRHKDELSLRKPEPTSIVRAVGFNKPVVTKFYDLLEELIDKYKFEPSRIFNCDETGISCNAKSYSKVIAKRGRKQVGIITSAEKGKTVTAEICFNAAGQFIPPLLVYPRVRSNSQLYINVTIDLWTDYHPSGWMQSDIFVRWLKKFIKYTNAKKENPVLLLLDGHTTHVLNLQLIDIARENGVIMLCFPPHCSHKLQPTDVAFNKPLSHYYERAVKQWMQNHLKQAVSMYHIAEIFQAAYIEAATMRTAMQGFCKTGIWPFNRNVFSDSEFISAETSDRPNPNLIDESKHNAINKDVPDVQEETNAHNSNLLQPPTPVTKHNSLSINTTIPLPETPANEPSTSFSVNSIYFSPATPKNSPSTSFSAVSPTDLIPIPKVQNNTNRSNRKRGTTVIITDSPYKNQLLENHRIKVENELAKKKKKLKFNKTDIHETRKANNRKPRRKFQKHTDRTLIQPAAPLSLNQPQSNTLLDSNKQLSNVQDTECLYCGELYSVSTESWVMCGSCMKWAHCSCAGEEENGINPHICPHCE